MQRWNFPQIKEAYFGQVWLKCASLIFLASEWRIHNSIQSWPMLIHHPESSRDETNLDHRCKKNMRDRIHRSLSDPACIVMKRLFVRQIQPLGHPWENPSIELLPVSACHSMSSIPPRGRPGRLDHHNGLGQNAQSHEGRRWNQMHPRSDYRDPRG